MTTHSAYLQSVMSGPESYAKTMKELVTVARLIVKARQVDTLAFTGVSGMSVGFTLGYKLGLNVVVLRKDDNAHFHHERSRKDTLLEGFLNPTSYLIIDDFICTGRSVNKVIEAVEEVAPKATLAGVLCFSTSTSTAANHTTAYQVFDKFGANDDLHKAKKVLRDSKWKLKTAL